MAKKKFLYVGLALSLCFVSLATAADAIHRYAIKDANTNPAVHDVLNGDISFYWATESHPSVVHAHGIYTTSRRTNGLTNSAHAACDHALASALIALQNRARREGGNAVIDLKSNLNNQEEESAVNYSCAVGAVMVNVALKGTVVTISK